MRSGLPCSRRRLSSSSAACVRAEIRDQLLAIGRANRRRAQRIHQQLEARQSEPAQEPRGQQNHFRIDVRPLESERLGIDLVELTIASRLRPLAPEHRAHAPHAQAPLAQQAVGDHRARDPRGRLGTQSDVILALIDEAEHLLLDDVGEVADRALEQLRLLDHGYAELLVAVAGEHLARDRAPGAARPRLARATHRARHARAR